MARTNPAPPDPTAEDAAFIKAVADGQASLDQGRSVSYERVRQWLLSWGTNKELPPPECP
jgi:predicted transcriptional regulator